MDSVVVDTNTGSCDPPESKSIYLILQPFSLKPGYIITAHCQAAASKFEGGNTDNSDDARGGGEPP